MYTPIGFVQPRSPNRLPDAPLNREHPKDGSLIHREGRVNKLTGERKGEVIKAQRHTTMSSRSKAGTPITFIGMNIASDRVMDAQPAQPNPGPAPFRRHVEHRRRLNRSA